MKYENDYLKYAKPGDIFEIEGEDGFFIVKAVRKGNAIDVLDIENDAYHNTFYSHRDFLESKFYVYNADDVIGTLTQLKNENFLKAEKIKPAEASDKKHLREKMYDLINEEKQQNFPPFLTGSYCYGTPNDKSDIDMVVLCDNKELIQALVMMNEGTDNSGGPNDNTFSLRFGKLNIIVCLTKNAYCCWNTATIKCIEENPISRDGAIEVFSTIFKRYGFI